MKLEIFRGRAPFHSNIGQNGCEFNSQFYRANQPREHIPEENKK